MFRITQGEFARASGICTAIVSLLLAGKKQASMRTAVSLIHGLEKLLTRQRHLDTAYFVRVRFRPDLQFGEAVTTFDGRPRSGWLLSHEYRIYDRRK